MNSKRASIVIAFVLLAVTLLYSCKPKSGPAGRERDGRPYEEIRVEVFNRGGEIDPAKNNWTDWIKNKLLEDENIGITFAPVPRFDEVPALNNFMAAGDPPDICFTYSPELINSFRDMGGLFNIAPYIDSHLPDLKAFLGPDLMLPGRGLIERGLDRSTGNLFYVPARRIFTGRYNVFIRKDWLDKLGLPLPRTTEEFYRALRAFKERDPGKVGREKVIPYISTKQTYLRFANMLESFIDPGISDRDRWIGTVAERSFLLPGYKEGVRALNKWYHEDLIGRDFPLYVSDNDTDSLIRSGIVGAFMGNYEAPYRGTTSNQTLAMLRENVPDGEIVPADPFTNSKGIAAKYCYDAAGMYIFIPITAKHPEAALRYLNWLAKFENRLFLQTGPEGITHELVDGIPKLKIVDGPWAMVSPQNVDYCIVSNGLELETPERTQLFNAFSYMVDPQLIINSNEIALKDAKPIPVVPVTLSAAGPYVRDLQDKGDVLMAESILCSPADFDRVWDKGIQDWLASGAKIIRDEREAKYIAP
jgi:putative aldouronate transport system substrate-binding protein